MRNLVASLTASRDEAVPDTPSQVPPVARSGDETGDGRRVGAVHTPRFDESRTREEFRVIKRHIMGRMDVESDPMGGPMIILVTSASPGEGKTTVSLGLALSFMFERDIRVVLMDADMRRADLTGRMRLDGAPGLLDYLDDNRLQIHDVLYPTSVSGVFAVPSGEARVAAPELIASRRMQILLQSLRASSQRCVVIIDSGSVLSCSETVSLAGHAGQIVFVAAMGQSTRREMEEGLAILHREAGPIDGSRASLVFNKTDHSQSPVRYARRR